MIHVTHDQTEAMALADRLAVMRDGRLEQVGPPHEVFGRPNSLFVARFLGTPPMNVVPLGVFGAAGTAILSAGARGLPGGAAPEHLLAGIRPESLHVVGAPGAGEIVLRGTLAWTEAAGRETFAYVEVPGIAAPLCATLPPRIAATQGSEVTLSCRRDDITFFDGRSGRALGADATPAPEAAAGQSTG
jgi:multiple sugar transport system ATP-binding protein/alpha-glucoside transport system ATP-binding protein